jgi:DNA-binding NarL/FixJ family response regulator
MAEEKQVVIPEQTKTIKILIADDHPLVRKALRSLIENEPKMKVVAEACNGIEAVKITKELLPDVVIMDIGMPILNGLEATRKIKTNHPSIAILVLTVHTDKEHIFGILEAGAAGYLTKVAFDNEIICAIKSIATGEVVLSPSILQQILSKHNNDSETEHISPSFNNLSSREILILKFAAKGLSNKNIAIELNLSESTIKTYLVTIFSKINVSSRTEAVITGLKAGLLSIRDLA